LEEEDWLTGIDVVPTVTDVDLAPLAFADAVAVKVPVPVCPPPLLMVNHDTGDVAVHVQFDPVVTVTVMASPFAAAVKLEGDSV
jgi:hypothetical protein